MSLGATGKYQQSFHVLLQTHCRYTQGCRQQMLVFVNVCYKGVVVVVILEKRELQSRVVVDKVCYVSSQCIQTIRYSC